MYVEEQKFEKEREKANPQQQQQQTSPINIKGKTLPIKMLRKFSFFRAVCPVFCVFCLFVCCIGKCV